MKNLLSISVDEIPSTQDLAKELINKEKYQRYDFIVITARRQTDGRGQRGNRWVSEAGGLYMTIATKTNENNLKTIQSLSIKTAQIVSELIKENYKIKTEIKPPNDVYVLTDKGMRKISGILIETTPINELRWIFIGIGINFHNPLPSSLAEKAANIYSITHKKHKISSFAKKLIQRMIELRNEIFSF